MATQTEVIQQPAFDPPYEPLVIDGKTMPDSILIECLDEDSNVFTYNAFDHQPRYFSIINPNGETVEHGEFEWGESFILPNEPGWQIDYYAGDIYSYKVVPGQCVVSTTTVPPSTTTTQPESSTTSTTGLSTSTTTPTTNSVSTEVTVQGTVTSLVPLPEVSIQRELPNTGTQFDVVAAILIAVSVILTGLAMKHVARRLNKPLDSAVN